jgi:anti-sigma regulatory factor (Ser/Thr protein kinase)
MRSGVRDPVQEAPAPGRSARTPSAVIAFPREVEPLGAIWACLPVVLSSQAPRVARDAIVDALSGRASSTVVERAKLIVSELVTNSLVHSGAGEGEEITVTVHGGERGCLIVVADPGHRTGRIAPRAPDRVHGGGMGLLVVDAMCAHWGVLRGEGGSNCVWAQLIDDDEAQASRAGGVVRIG